MLTPPNGDADIVNPGPNKHKGKVRKSAIPGLDISRIPHLLRPYLLNLNVLQCLIEKNGEGSTVPKSSAVVQESPVFKCGRSLANKVVRRYGRMRARNELADPTWTDIFRKNRTSVTNEGIFQYQTPHHKFFASTFEEGDYLSHAELETKRRIQTTVNSYESILRARDPASRTRGVRSLVEMSSTVVGRGMEDWIVDEVMTSSRGLPLLKDDGRILAARDYCYDMLPVHSRANILTHHAISLAINLPDHIIKFRLLARLADTSFSSGCADQAWLAIRALVPCPSLLHPDYLRTAMSTLSDSCGPELNNVVTAELMAHMATLNPVECFSESIQTFFGLVSGVDQANILTQVIKCTSRLQERSQDEDDMWEMLERWTELFLRSERSEQEVQAVACIFKPLFTRYLVEPRKSTDELHHILLPIAVSLISPDTIDFLGPVVAHEDNQSMLKNVDLTAMPESRLWAIADIIASLDKPFLEVQVLEALDSHFAISCRRHNAQRSVEMRLKDAQQRAREVRGGVWWDDALGEWVDSSPVKVTRTSRLSDDWHDGDRSEASSDDGSDDGSNFSTPARSQVLSVVKATPRELREEESDEGDGLSASSSPVRSKSGDSSLILDTPNTSLDLSSDPLAGDDDDDDWTGTTVTAEECRPEAPKLGSMATKTQPTRRVTFSRSLSYSTFGPSPLARVLVQPKHSQTSIVLSSILRPTAPTITSSLNAPKLKISCPTSNILPHSALPLRTPLGAVSQNTPNLEPFRTFTRTKSLPSFPTKRPLPKRTRAESEESEDPLDCLRESPETGFKRLRASVW